MPDKAKREKPEILPNGAVLYFVPWPWERWSITSGDGVYQGLRSTYEAARAFALTLPGSAGVAPQPVEAAPVGVPREERRDFDFSAPSRGEPVSVRRDPIEESRAMCRRQALAHDRVYGRHRR